MPDQITGPDSDHCTQPPTSSSESTAKAIQPQIVNQADSPPQPVSNAAPQEPPQNAQQAQQQTQPTASTQAQGNVPQASSGPVSVLVVNRGPGGKWAPTGGRRQEQGESERKAQSSAPTKPDGARTYDESASEAVPRERGIKGLDVIPKSWPELPGNVSLGQEIAWVQAERLRVVEEKGGVIRVNLSKAKTCAPSMAALSWLETSIRSYAKFIEVASKQASSGSDEAEFVRKERLAIGEIRSILQEMMVDKGS